MTQLKYLTDNAEELDAAEHDLEANGVPRSHIHVLSMNDAPLADKGLPLYSEWAKRDITHSGGKGAIIGLVTGALLLVGAYAYGVSESWAWAVLLFLSAVVVGFCTWEGGLVGVNRINHDFADQQDAINSGEHLLVVDAENPDEERAARYAIESHPVLRSVA